MIPLASASLTTLADIPSEAIPLAAIIGGITVALVAIITGGITGAAKVKAREQTRREVAAYVAEGSITPEEAEKILKGGRRSVGPCAGKEC